MQLQLKKTDSRFAGYERFEYYIKIIPSWQEDQAEEFYKLRHWCWETFGPSRELQKTYEIYRSNRRNQNNIYTGDKNDAWSWVNDDHRCRLYLKGKDEAALFKLKWS